MDKAKRDNLLDKIGDVNSAPCLVSLSEFFDGNDDGASIWCNLPHAPCPSDVLAVLQRIRDRDDVSDVLILVTQFDGAEDEWPFADTIYFVTKAEIQELSSWLGPQYQPDDIWIDQKAAAEHRFPEPSNMQVIGAWWD